MSTRSCAAASAARGPLLVAVVAAAIALAGCSVGSTATPTPATDSGIRGTVILAPSCAVEGPDATPCLTPYPAELVIADSEGNVVTRVRAGADGRFEVVLPPGDYTLLPVPGDPFPTATSRDVTVVPGQFEEIEINYDSGIR